MTYDEIVAKVNRLPGLTVWPPDLDAVGDRVEVATKIAQETATILEWSKGGSPRFMPKNAMDAEDIRDRWRSVDLNVADYGPPKKEDY